MRTKIRHDDEVIVISGRDKGKIGKVKYVMYDKGKVIVSGVNLVTKHQKPMPDKNKPGGLLKKEAAISLSNVAIFNRALNKADRIKIEVKDGKKIRIFKSNGSIIK